MAAMVIVAAAGCGGADRPRTAVAGSVRMGGKPAEMGFVRFVPLAAGPESMQVGTLVAISKGRYEVQTGGGLVPGEYRVEAAAERLTGRTTIVQLDYEEAPVPEREPASDAAYAGPDSPLRFTADGRRSATFNIDLPPGAR